jgi:hypothetical protein
MVLDIEYLDGTARTTIAQRYHYQPEDEITI